MIVTARAGEKHSVTVLTARGKRILVEDAHFHTDSSVFLPRDPGLGGGGIDEPRAFSNHAFVMDPYLDKTVMKPTAAELLASLNSAKRKQSGKDTDFMAFNAFHPAPNPPVTDISGKQMRRGKPW